MMIIICDIIITLLINNDHLRKKQEWMYEFIQTSV